VFNQFLEYAFGITPSRWFYGWLGVWVAQTFAFTPIAFMIMRGVVQGVAPSLEEAAQTLRASPHRTFMTVTLPLLKPGLHKVIGFARRDQGLIVARGNPLGLHALADLCRPDVRFVNRTLGTGTRLVLDELLQRDGLAPEQIRGYHGHAEPSHAAVAQSVAAGSADAGLGIASAAQAKGLDFVPLVQERYHLVCLKAALAQPAIQSLLQVLQQPAWHHQLGTIAGYVPDQCGSVLPLSRELPWWHFQRAGRAVATAA